MILPPSNQFGGQAPKKTDNRTTLILLGGSAIIALAVIVAAAVWLPPLLQSLVEFDEPTACYMDFNDVDQALRKYAADNGRYPDAATWQKDVKAHYVAYRKQSSADAEEFHAGASKNRMNPDGPWGCTYRVNGKEVKTGFALNKSVAGIRLEDIPNPVDTELLFEVPTVAANQALPYTEQDDSKYPETGGDEGWWQVSYVDESEY